MLYRDYMQKFRPLYAPDAPAPGADGAAPAGSAEAIAAPAAPQVPDAAAAPAAAADAGASPAEAAAAPAAGEAAPAGEPTLLEAADAKKREATAEAAAATDKESPAPEAKPEGDAKPDGTKDAKPEGGKKPEGEGDGNKDPEKKDATAESLPPAPIKYDAFKLPEGVKLDDERFGKFTEIAGNGQVSQEVAQSLLDLHIAEVNQARSAEQQHQRDVWKALNDTWKADFRKDPELGGNREQTTLARAKAVLEEYGGSPDQVKDLLNHTKANGMGNYVGFIRLLNNIGEALNIFEESDQPINPAPPKAATTRGQRWYGSSGASKA